MTVCVYAHFSQYDTDFYVLDKYPLAVRPFYTMPDPNNLVSLSATPSHSHYQHSEKCATTHAHLKLCEIVVK